MITRWRVLGFGFFIDGGGYSMPPSRRCPIEKGLPPESIRVFGTHTLRWKGRLPSIGRR